MEQEFEKLKKEKEELIKMNEVKSDLISISAHQLRTSLSALKWILKMFLEKDLGEITFEQESFIKGLW
jgi:signal transduction histidine kinase